MIVKCCIVLPADMIVICCSDTCTHDCEMLYSYTCRHDCEMLYSYTCRHDWTPFLCAKLRNSPVKHIDLKKKLTKNYFDMLMCAKRGQK